MIKSEKLKGKLSKDAYIAVLEAEIAMLNTRIENDAKFGALSFAPNAAAQAVYASSVAQITKKDAQENKNSEEHF